jgi:AcrR family transcriptional regulator
VIALEDRRDTILLAALQVFTERGYHNTAMDNVAARAAISKPVLYQYFPSKRDLYLGLLDDSADAVCQDVADLMAAGNSNHERVIAAVRYYFDAVDSADHGFRLIFETDFIGDADVRARVADVITRLSRLIGLEIAQATGLDSGTANLLAAGMCGMAQAAAFRWIALGRPLDKEAAVEQVAALGWYGLSALPAR